MTMERDVVIGAERVGAGPDGVACADRVGERTTKVGDGVTPRCRVRVGVRGSCHVVVGVGAAEMVRVADGVQLAVAVSVSPQIAPNVTLASKALVGTANARGAVTATVRNGVGPSLPGSTFTSDEQLKCTFVPDIDPAMAVVASTWTRSKETLRPSDRSVPSPNDNMPEPRSLP